MIYKSGRDWRNQKACLYSIALCYVGTPEIAMIAWSHAPAIYTFVLVACIHRISSNFSACHCLALHKHT